MCIRDSFVCGFLCPFGWLQELLHKIPCKKLSTKRLKPLTYIKYGVLLLSLIHILPKLARMCNALGVEKEFRMYLEVLT